MQKHHIDLIESAKAILSNLSSDELLDDFLELQENACGPTVHDFFQSMRMSTNELYGFNILNNDYSLYENMHKMDISSWAILYILNCSEDFGIKSANDETYHLNPQGMKKSDSFLSESEDDNFALAS